MHRSQLFLLMSWVRPFISAAGRPVILLLFNAGPLDISWAKEQDGVGAIVACFFPAETTGLAVAKMLVGAEGANPAGRLPATWPAGMDQVWLGWEVVPLSWTVTLNMEEIIAESSLP